jgi:hypothetical protein
MSPAQMPIRLERRSDVALGARQSLEVAMLLLRVVNHPGLAPRRPYRFTIYAEDI